MPKLRIDIRKVQLGVLPIRTVVSVNAKSKSHVSAFYSHNNGGK